MTRAPELCVVCGIAIAAVLTGCATDSVSHVRAVSQMEPSSLESIAAPAPYGGVVRLRVKGKSIIVEMTGGSVRWSSEVVYDDQPAEDPSRVSFADQFYGPAPPNQAAVLIESGRVVVAANARAGSGTFVIQLDLESGMVQWTRWVGVFRELPLLRRNPIPGTDIYNTFRGLLMGTDVVIVGYEGAAAYCAIVSARGDVMQGEIRKV